ncbi:MAG: hypothetical protein ACJ762_04350 [Solirubrobacteraceae bacterium]
MTVRSALTLLLVLACPASAGAAWTKPRAVTAEGWQTAELALGESGDVALAASGAYEVVGQGYNVRQAAPLQVLRGTVRSRLPRRQVISRRMELLLALRPLADRSTVAAWTELVPDAGDASGASPVPVAALAARDGRFGGLLVVGPHQATDPHVAVGSTGVGLTVYRSAGGAVSVTRWRAGRPGRRHQEIERTAGYPGARVAIGAAHDAVVAWCGGADGTEVRYVTGDARRPFGAPATIPGARCGAFLAVAAGRGGRAVATWLLGRQGSAMSVRPPGGAFGQPVQLATETAGIPIPLAGPGDVTGAIWTKQLGPSDTGRLDVGGRPGAVFGIPCPTWGETGFDASGDLTVMGSRIGERDRICTRRAGGRWSFERVPRGGTGQFAAGRAGRAVAGVVSVDGGPPRVWYAGD